MNHDSESARIPRAVRLRTLLLLLLVAAAAFLAGTRIGPIGAVIGRGRHPSAPGGGQPPSSAESGAPTFFTCGMHPWVVLPSPGDCPICHMKLTPLDPAKFTGEVSIDPVVVQNIGVRIAPVTLGPLTHSVRTVGTVEADETRVRDVDLKVEGWIEDLGVDYLGAPVRKGQALFHFYAPKIYSTQENYLQLLRNRDAVKPGVDSEAAARIEQLLEQNRRRLRFYDLTEAQIEALGQRTEPQKALPILSPFDGVVMDKHANEGMYVTPGMRVFQIADLSRVWVMVTLYESQLPFVEVGQEARIELSYVPGAEFHGKVLYQYPTVDPRTREGRVRLEFENPQLLLKPGMFANVEIQRTLARDRVLAPREAVIDTGERQVAFVSLGEGRFEPRPVRMGVESDDGRVEIVDGLKPGEMVVVSAQFLLDSEARLREALGKMIRGEMAADQAAIAAVSGQSELETLPAAMSAPLAALLDASFALGSTLAADSVDGTRAPAEQIARRVDELLALEVDGHPHFWHEHEEVATLRGEALAIAGSRDLEEMRLHFADLSVALTRLLRATGIPPDYGKSVQELHCPMYREGQGGSTWLQPNGPVRNPFYGSSMLECFDRRSTLPVTGLRSAEPAANAPAGATPDEVPRESTEDAKTTEGGSEPAIRQSDVDSLARDALGVHRALAKDQTAGLSTWFAQIHEAAQRLEATSPDLSNPLAVIVAETESVPDELEAARNTLRAISPAVLEILREVPASTAVAPRLHEAFCPMSKGGVWLQEAAEVENPYYGTQMPHCGELRGELPIAPPRDGP